MLGEGAVKLQPLPLPQGMTPSSTEIIASLNEHLIQVLQVRGHCKLFLVCISLCWVSSSTPPQKGLQRVNVTL